MLFGNSYIVVLNNIKGVKNTVIENKEDYNTCEQFENRILIIGNGFDLALGYKTKYSDFGKFVKDRITNTSYQKNLYYKRFNEIVECNKFISFFSYEKYDLWSDIEYQLQRIVDSIKLVFDKKEKCYEYRRLGLLKKYPVIVNKLEPFDKRVLSTFGFIKSRGGNDYISKEYIDKINGIKREELLNYLREEFEELKEAFVIYLKEFVPIIFHEDKTKNDESAMIKRENNLSFFKTVNPQEILTLNYTDYWREAFPDVEVHYVHGSLLKNNIVVGYQNDINQDYDFDNFKKYLQIKIGGIEQITPQSSVFNKKDPFLDGMGLEASLENIIMFYGLSLGTTDSDFIKTIFNATQFKKIVIYCRNEDEHRKRLGNLYNIVGKEKIMEDENADRIVFKYI